MKNRKLLLITSIAALSLLVSCTKPATPSSESKEESSSSETSSGESKPSGKVKIVFWHTFGDQVEKAVEQAAEDFTALVKANEDVDVEIELSYQGGYKDMTNKVTLGLSNGDSPSIAVAYPDHVAEYFQYEKENNAKGRYVVNFDKYINDPKLTFGTDTYLGDTEDVNDFIPAFLDEGRQFTREGLYVLPFMKSSEVMIYNLDAAKRAMALYDPSIPEDKVAETINAYTFEELLEFGKFAYQHKDAVSSELEYSIYYDSDANFFISKMYQKEIPFTSIGDKGKGVLDFATGDNLTNAKAMVESYANYHKDHALTTKGVNGEHASNNFKEEKCIFTIGSSGGAGYTFPPAGDFDVEITAVPASNDNPLYVSQGVSLAMFNRPELTAEQNKWSTLYSWKFIKYLTSTHVNIECTIGGSQGYVPVRGSCYATEEFLDFQENGELYAQTANVLLYDIDGRYLITPVFTGSAVARDVMGSVLGNALAMQDMDPSSPEYRTLDQIFATAINTISLELRED